MPELTTVAAKQETQRELRAAAALLGVTVADLLARIAQGDGPTNGENVVDWAQRLSKEAAEQKGTSFSDRIRAVQRSAGDAS